MLMTELIIRKFSVANEIIGKLHALRTDNMIDVKIWDMSHSYWVSQVSFAVPFLWYNFHFHYIFSPKFECVLFP